MAFSRQECWSGWPPLLQGVFAQMCCSREPGTSVSCCLYRTPALKTTLFSDALIFSCCCSVIRSCLTLCNPMDCSTRGFLSFTVSRSLLKLMCIEWVMPPNHLTLCRLFANGDIAITSQWLWVCSVGLGCSAGGLADESVGIYPSSNWVKAFSIPFLLQSSYCLLLDRAPGLRYPLGRAGILPGLFLKLFCFLVSLL